MMTIKIAKVAGYCFGIQNAIEIAEKSLEENSGPIYSLGDISHNHQEMQRLQEKGISKIDDVDQIDSGTVIIRTHGVSKEIIEKLESKDINIIDATCPYVKNIHKKVEKFDREGYQIVIIGNQNHPEVIGSKGWSSKDAVIISTIEEAKALDDYDKICIVAQTTFINEKFNEIVEVLRTKSRDILVFNTICSATALRQEAAVELAKQVDGMVVVGGYHSSNTQKLKEVCEAHCKNIWHVETAEDLDLESLKSLDSIGLTAGASTPVWLIEEVTEKMEENKLDQEVVVEEVEIPEETVSEDNNVIEETSVEPEENTEVLDAPVEEVFLGSEEDGSDEEIDFATAVDNMVSSVRKNHPLTGEVISISDDEVIVKIPYKQDAVIYKRDFTWKRDEDLQNLVKVGDQVTAIVTDLNDGEGRVKLSKIKYDNREIQDRLGKAYEDREILRGKITKVSGSGLIVDVGFAEIFMPASQYHLRYVKDLESLVGNEVRGVIIDYNAKRRRAILSQKVLLQEEKDQRQREQQLAKEKRYDELNVDDVITGKVKTIADFGVFVDLDGIDGFVHRSDLTWDRNNNPSALVEKGQEIETKIIAKNDEDKKIKLSVKALQERPWEKFIKSYAINDEIDVDITNTLDFGAFAQIIAGVEGLIHISEISYDRVEKVSDVLKPGETVKVKIIGIDEDKEKISLSIKATLPRPEYVKRPKRNVEEGDFEERPRRRSRKNERSRSNRQQSNRNRTVYDDSAEFTLGDSFGDLLGGIDFGFEDEEEE